MKNTTQHWLTLEDTDEIAAEARRRINNYAEHMRQTGRASVMQRMSKLAFSRDADSGLRATGVQTGGRRGELIGTRANLLGRYVRAVSVMVTGSRPSYQARSIASSAEALSHVNAANGLLDFMLSKKGAEEAARRCEVFESLYGGGWIGCTWDFNAGRKLGAEVVGPDGQTLKDPNTGAAVAPPPGMELPPGYRPRQRYEGDVVFTAKRPDEVVTDVDLDEASEHEWLIVYEQVNKFKLAAMYPENAEYILSNDTVTELEQLRSEIKLSWNQQQRRTNGDMIGVYNIIAPPSMILPEGFFGRLLGQKLIVKSRALYDDLAHYPMISTYEPGTKNGHSFMWDLCGLQQCTDAAMVSIISTIENYGKPFVFVPDANDLDTTKEAMMRPFHVISGSLPPAILGMDPNILVPLIEARNQYEGLMTTITGLNDVALGDAGKSQSGDALETMQMLAMQSVSGKQASYRNALGQAIFGGLKWYRAFATEQRLIQISGDTYSDDVKRFKASDIMSIDGVDAEMTPAVSQSNVGKTALADKFWNSGALGQDPQRYLQVAATGRVEPILEGPNAQRKLVQQENEKLREGKFNEVFVLPTDDDAMHMVEHAIPLADAARRNPQDPFVIGTLAHWQAHMQQLAAKNAPPPPPPGAPNAAPPGAAPAETLPPGDGNVPIEAPPTA